MPAVTRTTAAPVRKVAKTGDVWDRVKNIGFSEDAGIKVMLYGKSGCLTGDTFVTYQVRNPKTGKMQNTKGGTLELLYRRFHNLPRKGKGYYQRKQTLGSSFYVPSITDEGRITYNLVKDVIDSGDRQVLEIVTESGKTIRATANHKFMVEDGYKRLGELRVGDEVMVSPGKRINIENKSKRLHRPEVLVKNHARGRKKVVNGCTYYRMPRAHFVYEANRNGMTETDYREFLNTATKEETDSLWTVPEGAEIHHLDENPLNDVPDNLELAESSAEHQKLYHVETALLRKGMSIYVIPDRIVSITVLGVERVYDITMAAPYHNFVANGFAVHNSGKTELWGTFPGPILVAICSGGKKPGELRTLDTPANRKGRIKEVALEHSQELVTLAQGAVAHGFKTVVLDHVTGFQDLVLGEIIGRPVPEQKSWGIAQQQDYAQCALQCKEKLRHMLDLDINVVLIGQERENDKPEQSELIQPSVGVATTPSLAGWLNTAVDYIAHTFIRDAYETKETRIGEGKAAKVMQQRVAKKGPDGMQAVEYCLRTAPSSVYMTKFRTPKGTGDKGIIVDPSYDKIMAAIRGESASE